MSSYRVALGKPLCKKSISRTGNAVQSLALIFFVFFLCVFPASATGQNVVPLSPQLYELPKSGPPTSFVLIQGAGFDPITAVDVYFDSSKLASTTTDKNGFFGNGIITATGATFVRIQVPATALPGQHTITAQQRVGQKSAQIAFLVQTDWPQFHFDAQRTGFNPYENVLSAQTVGNLTTRWKYTIGGGQVWASPTVANGVVYASRNGDNNLYAFDAGTGAVLWKFPVTVNPFGGPAVSNGVVYVSSYGGSVYALNASSGVPLWSYSLPPGVSSAVVANGVVYVGSEDFNVYAINASTGALLWKYATGGGIFEAAPAVANGVVYVGSGDGNLYALDAGTGAFLWKFALTPGYVHDAPVVANGMAYITCQGIYALNASTGALIWKSTAFPGLGSPAVANGVVYVGSYRGDSQFGTLYALNAGTGSQLWLFRTGDDLYSSPAVANGVVYVGSSDFNIYALEASTGLSLWYYTTGAPVTSSPAVVNGMVYVGSYDGNVYAFGLPQQMSEKFSTPERPDPARLTPEWSPSRIEQSLHR